MAIDYFSEEQLSQLLTRLMKLTSDGALKWKALSDSEYNFGARAKSNVFTIQSKDNDDYAPHVLGIYTDSTDDKSLRELQKVDSQYTDSPELNDRIEDLYQLVKRQTLQIDVIAKNILSDLDEFAHENEPPF